MENGLICIFAAKLRCGAAGWTEASNFNSLIVPRSRPAALVSGRKRMLSVQGNPGADWKIFVVSADGGSPEQVISARGWSWIRPGLRMETFWRTQRTTSTFTASCI